MPLRYNADMNKVEVLIEGYATITDKGWKASGSTCLITTESGLKIITDPGANRDILLQKLREKGLRVEDIDFVFLTHHHLDHAMLAGIFPNAKVVDEEAIYTQDDAIEGTEGIPGTNMTIIATPGHEAGHGILVVPETEKGTIVIAGDNFWWKTDEEQKLSLELDMPDDFAEDMEVLKNSRAKVLEIADWVVPGHGRMFQAK